MSHFDSSKLDWVSYNLGIIVGFAECVGAGIKKIALSASMTHEQYESIKEDVKLIAVENHSKLYVDNNFLETLLFPAEYTKGKIVIHIYKDKKINDEYLALKEKKKTHEKAGTYTMDVQREVAWTFGKLLSYDDEAINRRFEIMGAKPS
jgi:hypothetical protein